MFSFSAQDLAGPLHAALRLFALPHVWLASVDLVGLLESPDEHLPADTDKDGFLWLCTWFRSVGSMHEKQSARADVSRHRGDRRTSIGNKIDVEWNIFFVKWPKVIVAFIQSKKSVGKSKIRLLESKNDGL